MNKIILPNKMNKIILPNKINKIILPNKMNKIILPNKMNKIILPNEIINIILNHYWQFKFNDVINELKQPYIIEYKIINFLNTYCFTKDLIQKKHIHYYIFCNTKIKDLQKNKINKLICKLNNLKLYFCFSENTLKIFNHIHKDLIYIMIFSISISDYYRFLVYHDFIRISNLLHSNASIV